MFDISLFLLKNYVKWCLIVWSYRYIFILIKIYEEYFHLTVAVCIIENNIFQNYDIIDKISEMLSFNLEKLNISSNALSLWIDFRNHCYAVRLSIDRHSINWI